MALYQGARLDLRALLWGQMAITSVQWMTHYSNDYFDLAGDRLNRTPTPWSGGSQVLPRGLLPPAVALVAAVIFAVLAIVAAVVLSVAVRPGLLTAVLLILPLLLAWSYSAPPIRLHSRGLGELTVVLLVAGLTPQVGFYLQTGRLTPLSFLAVVPLCCLQLGMILAVALPDLESDVAVGKRTLVVLLGRLRAVQLYALALLATYAVLPTLVVAGLPGRVALAVCLGAPLAVWRWWRLWQGDWRVAARWRSLAFWGIALLIITAILELLTFAALSWSRLYTS